MPRGFRGDVMCPKCRLTNRKDPAKVRRWFNSSLIKISATHAIQHKPTEGKKEMLNLTTHSTHFIYGYMASKATETRLQVSMTSQIPFFIEPLNASQM